MMRTRTYLTIVLIAIGFLPQTSVAQSSVVLVPSFHLCAPNNNCAEGFHVSDQIAVFVHWTNRFGFFDVPGHVEFGGDLGNTAVDPFVAGVFGPGGTLEPNKCHTPPSFFFTPFFVTQYARPGFHTIQATLFGCDSFFDGNSVQWVPNGQVLATTSLTINVLPDHHPKIHSVELTQAIQEWQELADLKS